MSIKSEGKIELILINAKRVFIRKGFGRVTMKDIIDECGISRGGVYLYFSSIDEIFINVVKKHNEEKIKQIKEVIRESDNFIQLVNDFFNEQKERLLNMDKSLFAAMMEFCFSHKDKSDRDFYAEQFFNTKNIVIELLKFGIEKSAINPENVDCLADSIMFLLEGLRALAVSSRLTEKLADEQIKVCKDMVFSDIF